MSLVVQKISSALTVCLIAAALAAGCGQRQPKTRLIVLHSNELTSLFRNIEEAFELTHPDIDIRAESEATMTTIRKLTDMSKNCDLIAISDPDLLRSRLYPKAAKWIVAFAGDEIVLAAANRSRYIHEMDGDNWYQILLRPDVSFARVDERLDPLGRHTLVAWQLADAHYGSYRGESISDALANACPPNNVRPDGNVLMTLLETPSGPDYVFVPRSLASLHRRRFIELPEAINLGNIELSTAGTGLVEAVWRHCEDSLKVHQQLLRAINKASNPPRVPDDAAV